MELFLDNRLNINGVNLMEGIRVQMLINRSVGNTNKGSIRWVSKLISHDEKTFKRNAEKLCAQMIAANNPGFRLYASINSRNSKLAAKHLISQMIDHLDEPEWVSLIHQKLVSNLMNPLMRSTSYFLIDVDTPCYQTNEIVRREIGNAIITQYSTPNGFHFITKGFDVRKVLALNEHYDKPIIEFKRDALMLLAYAGEGWELANEN